MIWRGYCQYTYTTCQRCQRKVPLSDCNWNAGILVCHIYGCYDRIIFDAITLAQAREVSRDRNELVPDPKLINPVDPLQQLEMVPASAGTW